MTYGTVWVHPDDRLSRLVASVVSGIHRLAWEMGEVAATVKMEKSRNGGQYG